MKAKSLSALALVALLGAGVAAPAAASAEAKSQPSTGIIKFKDDDTKSEIDDPETDDKVDEEDDTDDVTPNPDRGAFSIDATTNYNFSENNVTGIEVAKSYAALPANVAVINKDTGAKSTVQRGHFVQFSDKRATSDHRYTLSAQLTEQFSVRDASGVATSDILKGANLAFTNGVVTSSTTTSADLFPVTAAENGNISLDLAPAADGTSAGISTPVITNTQAAKGMGTYTLEFGTNADGTDASSVNLNVPAGNVISANEYKAVITWSIAEVPAP